MVHWIRQGQMVPIDYRKLSALVVEDEAFTRRAIRNLLYQAGLRTIQEAANGRDGLLAILDTRPDVVFCDVHMKPLTGLEMVEKLRASDSPEIAGTAVVMLTSDASRDSVIFARKHAVEGYLVKPVGFNQIRSRLEAVILARPDLERRLRGVS